MLRRLSNSRVSALSSAVFSIAIQVVSLLALAPSEYGLFSIIYLLFALFSSVQLSVVLESWLRSRGSDTAGLPRLLRPVALQFAAYSGALAGIVCVCVPSLRHLAISAAVGVGANVYVVGARYILTWEKTFGRIVAANAAGAILTVGLCFVVFPILGRTATAVTLLWACTSLVTAVMQPCGAWGRFGDLRQWVREHRHNIGVLLRDSLVMDLSSIGVPYLLAPVLGAHNFGVYRAVSNVAAPVRIVMTPLRPSLLQQSLDAARRPRRLLLVLGATVAFAVAAAAALLLLPATGLNLGTINYLEEYALITGVFVGSNFLITYCYIVARAHASAAGLAWGRLTQTGLSIVLPVALAFTHGLTGAIYGYVGATALVSVVWLAILLRAAPRAPQHTPKQA
ncbi:hypothetical protein JT358_07745 [Micrococcales bacterium 31B]|nr:hypothetical protein [Micrococcales bacterium 31B]